MTTAPAAGGDHNKADVMFARMMIPHHEEAIEMAQLAVTRASSADVKSLAARIKAAQRPEIDEMKGWLAGWGVPTMPGGMANNDDMAKLGGLSGAKFDRAFLTEMTTHHQGAIDMAKAEKTNGSYGPAKTMAANIIRTQTAEINKMTELLKGKLGVEVSDSVQRAADPIPYARSWALDEIEILRAGDGGSDGRTVTAYAAVFDTPTEITDAHGHYMERIDQRAFNRQLGLGIDRVGVFYHHGLTIHGTPSDMGSVPIGSPVDIRVDTKGLRTVTRFNRSPLADSVLEAIRAGDIRGYSFRGRIHKSSPERIPRVTRSGAPLPTVTRTELGLTEYGPTPTPAYAGAAIVDALRALQALASTTPYAAAAPDEETPPATSTPEPGDATDQPADGGHSRRDQQLLRLRAGLRDRGLR